jgi:acyl-CoA reductase-like NAD-dependent aldehyde dehydrogenase
MLVADERRARALIGGAWSDAGARFTTTDPFRGAVFGNGPDSGPEEVAAAVAAARRAAAAVASAPARERAALLRRAAATIADRREDLARTMAQETGKAIRDAIREVDRSAETIELSAEEAVRIEGAHIPMDATAQGAGKLGVVMRFPVGVIAAITPYNAPLNLACHKIGPAIAAGNSVVLKPAVPASVTVHKLVEAFRDAGLPAGWLNAVYGEDAGRLLAESPDIDGISFTGSTRVGTLIRRAAPLKPVTLELGGNSFTVVHEDADVEGAAEICALNSMRLAGQSCISVQNVCVHRSLLASFERRLVDGVARLRLGDPLDDSVDLGPVISRAAAQTIEMKIQAAIGQGAGLLLGGGADGALVQPTVLYLSRPGGPTFDEEIFGPVVNLIAFDDLAEPISWINNGRYGLQAGVFTRSIETAMRLTRALRVGGVIINGSSTWRSDQAPYGGVKDSGCGREGPHYAINDMTEERFMVINH